MAAKSIGSDQYIFVDAMVRLTSRMVRKKGCFCIGSISEDRKEFQAELKDPKVKDIIIIIMLGISMDRINKGKGSSKGNKGKSWHNKSGKSDHGFGW
jgi:hypothetical protein